MNTILLISIAICIEIVTSEFHNKLTRDQHLRAFKAEPGTVTSEHYEVVPVIHSFEYNSNEIDGEPWHPRVEIRAFNKNFTLYLEPNDHVLFGRNTPVFKARLAMTMDGTYDIEYTRQAYSLPKKIQLYHDRKNGAAVTAYADRKNNRLHLEGLVGDGHYIRPIPNDIYEQYFGNRPEAYIVQSNPNGHSFYNNPPTHHIVMNMNHDNWFDQVNQHPFQPPQFYHGSNGFGESVNQGYHPDFSNAFGDSFPSGHPNFYHDPHFFPQDLHYYNQHPPDVLQNIGGYPGGQQDYRDYEYPTNGGSNHYQTSETPRKTKPRESRSAGSGVKYEGNVVYPEILVIVDRAIFESHNSDVKDLCLYMAAFWNAVDLRFRELQDPKVRLNIAGIIIPEGPEAAPYLEMNKVGSDLIDVHRTLASMGQYFSKPGYPCNFDLVIAATKYVLHDENLPRMSSHSGNNNLVTAGMAFVEGACKIESRFGVGIFGEDGPFKRILPAAHELAHLLGSPHDKRKDQDGYKGGPCDWDHGYLMSYVVKDSNAFHWSPCSKETMRNFFRNGGGACLWNKPDPGEPLPKFLPGTLLNRHKQCEVAFGPGYRANETYSALADCITLSCIGEQDTPQGRLNMRGNTGATPAEGTSCGEASICLDGFCVLDPEKRNTGAS